MAIQWSWMAVVAIVIAVIAAGCADDPTRPVDDDATTRPTSPTTLPDLSASVGLAASIRQFREDEVVDIIQVELVRALTATADDTDPDAGATPTDLLTVTSVRLDWPGFEPVPATIHPVGLAAGQRVDIPTPQGAVRCASNATPDFSLGTVDAVVEHGDGTTETVRAPLLADAQRALDNVWTKGCVRQRLIDAVGLSYASPWTRADPGGVPTATTDLVITRKHTDRRLAITGVDGSVLLFVNPTAPLPNASSTVAVGVTSAATPIAVTGAGRCDGHALSDSKKTYIFQILVKVGDDDPVGIDLPVPDADRRLLNEVIVDTCGSDHRR